MEFPDISQVNVAEQLSEKVAGGIFIDAPQIPVSLETLISGFADITGFSLSVTVTVNVHLYPYSLADELRGSGIHVAVVSPGPIDTGFIMGEIDEVEDIVYSQPMSSPERVADCVVQLAQGKAVEIVLPKLSGLLTTLGYVFPSLRRLTRGTLYKIGHKNKAKYRSRNKL